MEWSVPRSSIVITSKLVRNVGYAAPALTHRVRICIFSEVLMLRGGTGMIPKGIRV